MMDRKALVGLLSGVSLVVATLIAVALLNMPETASAAKSTAVACSTARGAPDRAYGLVPSEGGCAIVR